jgi:hypothetical protein
VESTVNRFSTLTAIMALCLGIAVATDRAGARQKSLTETIIGTWSVTAVSDQYEDGKKSNAWGDGMKGNLIFDRNGRFSHILIGEKQPNVEADDPRRPDALVVAYFGSYTVNEKDKVVSVWIERGTNSARDGEAQKWAVTMTGDTLALIGSPHNDSQGLFSQHLEIKRAM